MRSTPGTDLAPGMRLDRYEIIERINRGGMASVWVARLVGEPGSPKLFALKTILPELADDPNMRAMFLDEANIASQIDHPNVAHVFELGEAQGVLFQVMELVKGESLGDLQRAVRERGEAFPMGVAMRICADACLGLHAAHEQRDPDGNPAGIVHRDVSPQNILVSRAGVAKVIDFGIAKAVNRASEETRTGLMKGKLRYMAPEQATRGEIDRRADVWSMGAVFYGLMNGGPPFEVNGDVQIIARLVKGIGPEPLKGDVPAVVRTIIAKAMKIDRNERYASTLEMAKALEAVMISTAATTSQEEVGAFCVTNARDAGDADRSPDRAETETDPSPRTSRTARMASNGLHRWSADARGLGRRHLRRRRGRYESGDPTCRTFGSIGHHRRAGGACTKCVRIRDAERGAFCEHVFARHSDHARANSPPSEAPAKAVDPGISIDGDPRSAKSPRRVFRRNASSGGDARVRSTSRDVMVA